MFDTLCYFIMTDKKTSSKRSRSFCLTVNNYDNDYCDKLKTFIESELSSNLEYAIYGFETASTGTKHIQGYIYFKNARSWSSVLKSITFDDLIKPHLEIAKGSPSQNRVYCSKENQFHEFGKLPSQGARSDLQIIREDLKNGKKLKDMLEDRDLSLKSIQYIENIRHFYDTPRNFKPYVIWIYGDSGLGKSRLSAKLAQNYDTYILNPSSDGRSKMWFDGYDNQEIMIINDFRSEMFNFSFLLNLLDRYPIKVEPKGKPSRQFNSKVIIINCPKSWHCYVPPSEDPVQLSRRISVCFNIKSINVEQTLPLTNIDNLIEINSVDSVDVSKLQFIFIKDGIDIIDPMDPSKSSKLNNEAAKVDNIISKEPNLSSIIEDDTPDL